MKADSDVVSGSRWLAGKTRRMRGKKRSERDEDAAIGWNNSSGSAARKEVGLLPPGGGIPLQQRIEERKLLGEVCESPAVCGVNQWMDETPDTAEMENIAVLEKREVLKSRGWQEEEGGFDQCGKADDGMEHIAPVPFFLEAGSKRLEDYAPDAKVAEALLKAGMPEILYDWQAECLSMGGVLQGSSNLVYCAPTSGGKSAVSEVLMVRRVVLTGKPAMLVLPFVSICAEKSAHYKKVFGPLKKEVVEFYGGQHTSMQIPLSTGMIVCTIEKANIMLNQWLEESTLSSMISGICVDELHMVGDADRGYILELLLTKLRYLSQSMEENRVSSGLETRDIQIVAMSATISNVDKLASWLGAMLYKTDYRPIPLKQYLVSKDDVLDQDGKSVRNLPLNKNRRTDEDILGALVQECVQDGHSVIVFCASRSSCERTATFLSKKLDSVPERQHLTGEKGQKASFTTSLGTPESELFAEDDMPSRELISQAIESHENPGEGKSAELKGTLSKLVSHGIGYHHAGLESEERELVELAFKTGKIQVICATSTLAAGVNLPARRVIFKHPYVRFKTNLLDPSKYKQMAGRAGRAGLDTLGESFLMSCKGIPDSRLLQLMNQDVAPLESCLQGDKKGMHRAMLEVIATGMVRSPSDVERYVKSTLLAATASFDDVVEFTKMALTWLGKKEQGYIVWDPQKQEYRATNVGVAVQSSGLPPEICIDIMVDLNRAREALVLASDLHLTYICVPLNEDIHVDWQRLLQIVNALSSLNTSILEKVGVSKAYLTAQARGYGMKSSTDITTTKSTQYEQERICKRFWVALILTDLVQEVSLIEIQSKYGVPRGIAQGLQDRASRYAGMLSAFCARIGWTDMEALISTFQARVLHGVRPEMLDLMQIPRVKPYAARLFYKAGFKTPESIAAVQDPAILQKILATSSKRSNASGKNMLIHCRRIMSEARELLQRRAAALQQQAQDVLRHAHGVIHDL